LSPIKQNQD